MWSNQKNNKILSIMLTYQCTSQCANCATLSKPYDKTFLPLELAIKAIEQAYKQNYKIVVFTGGEATLSRENLKTCIKRASSLGMETRLATNAYWASDSLSTRNFIKELIELGLSEINFSTGDEHLQYVPLNNITMAVYESVTMGLNTAVMIESRKERIFTKESFTSNPKICSILDNEDLNQYLTIVESPWMPLSIDKQIDYPDDFMTNDENLFSKTGCEGILRDLNIGADGSITACCGISWRVIPELNLGNIRHTTLVEAEIEAREDFLKNWLSTEGPENILAWAAKHNPEIIWQNKYAHHCQACLRIYKDDLVRDTIMKHYKEKLPDVLLGKWILNQ